MSSRERAPDQTQPKVRGNYEIQASSICQSTASHPSRPAGGGNNPLPAPYHGPESQPLIDFSSPMNTHGHFGNVPPQPVHNGQNSFAMHNFFQAQETRVNTFLQYSEKRVEEHRTVLHHLTGNLSNIINNFSHNVAHWLGHPAANNAAQLYHELGQSVKKYEKLKIEYQKLKSENEAIKKQLKETSNKLAKTTAERDEQLRLAEGANWTGLGKVADDTVKSKWKELDYNIRCMSMALAKCESRRPIDRTVKERFSSIAPNWHTLLADEDYKEFILHAYIWMVVFQQVFEDRDGIQGGGYVRNLKAVREQLVARAPEVDGSKHPSLSARHVARWSAQGAALFGHFFERDQKALNHLASEEIDKLKSFCRPSSKKPTTDFLQDMKTIIRNALDLDEMLMNSRAIFTVRWCDNGQSETLRFDETRMEASAHNKDLSPKSAVEFEISPMLIKTGNADGGNYDSFMILCKASVVCD
ncbi:hypothetical protein NW768_006659 [Fusarium equiseti]|uniref:Uncharacterized protein n=1 Tax=Fusarium equiseti TaxID=61235 RepID=A0ABQ8RCP1_FUSEQ|nr:hypothetical protein NW768_006659 [Fusarium equiseti]